ncbi:hypothetical protein V499_02382 [Pseudogymnoascus sp. VKM F-103]|uniref:Fe2OG dioxygenase domain-containing protein n=1 Tax=Pseudogymnoascus verrucosus TaxID=342668 RepID=A0A1B8GM22_9PEZI|nr:uncharacterized protein VE01_05492 [Pseudogymnoascus verrucosus]KFY78481.1 hypothetical protein V499_02382 [Pseudogymnoascus sp. VKM F-103]OBT96891.1 hypothetical protein VE01_05492 [Pseudogymnoascus verrucosus]
MAISPNTTSSSAANLPIIDFSKLEGYKNSDGAITAEESSVEKRKLFQALKDVGFVYLRNHGIDESAVQTIFAHAARFFSQPISEKEKVETGESKFFHGWFSPERTSGSSKFSDQKEAFDLGDDSDVTRPNQWPADWPEFRTDMNAFFERSHDIHLGLLSTLAEEVGLPRNYFLQYVQDKDHFFRVLHYPETTIDTFETRVRAGVHTDYGTLTLLFNDSNGGLQVRGKDGRFFDVPPIPGCAIINVGDLLSRWFNGVLKSTEHQVIEPPTNEATRATLGGTIHSRYAIAWFGHPNRNAFIEPLSVCVTEDNPKHFEGVFAGKHVVDRLAKLHKDGKNSESWEDNMYRENKSQGL